MKEKSKKKHIIDISSTVFVLLISLGIEFYLLGELVMSNLYRGLMLVLIGDTGIFAGLLLKHHWDSYQKDKKKYGW